MIFGGHTKANAMSTAVEEMFAYRGYDDIKKSNVGAHHIVVGKNQTNKAHPRPGAGAVALVDANLAFAGVEVQKTMRILYHNAYSAKLEPESSILFIYQFPMTRAHELSIERAYRTILLESNWENPNYFLEMFNANLFRASNTRSSRGWQLMDKSEFVLAVSTEGEDVTIDRPPLITGNDPWTKYIGGRPGDHVSFERLESMDVGPMWLTAMAKIMPKFDSIIEGDTAPTGDESGFDIDTSRPNLEVRE